MMYDVLCMVDGTCVLGWDLDEVCNKIKGEEGTPVVLEFRRGDNAESFKVKLNRGGDQLWRLPKANTPRGGSMPPPLVRGASPALARAPDQFTPRTDSSASKPRPSDTGFDYGMSGLWRH